VAFIDMAPVSEPPDADTLTVAVDVVTQLPWASAIQTTGWVASSDPDGPATGPRLMSTRVAEPGRPCAAKVTGDPVSPVAVAVTVLVPTTVPRVHVGAVAMPDDDVDTVAGPPRDPPPPVTAKVTDIPETGLPAASRTITAGAVAAASPAVPVWLSTEDAAIEVAVPEPEGVNVDEVTDVSAPLAKVSV
jgi:hypothetical protein